MKLFPIAVASAAFLSGHLTVAADDTDDTDSASYLRFSFDKLYGSSYETASKRNKPRALLYKRADGTEEIDLTNQQSFYSVQLEIGTPSQEVVVLLDTGSSDLWVSSPDNPYCMSDSDMDDNSPFGWLTESVTASGTATGSSSTSVATIDCSKYGTFDPSNSSTFSSNNTAFSISYGDGTYASGTWGTDKLNLGDLNVSDVSIAVANSSNSTVGVMGIGLAGLESTYSGVSTSTTTQSYQYANFPIVLKNEGIIKKNAYSLFLNDANADSGSILFGGVDHSKYSGQLYTIPILNLYKSKGISTPLEFDVTVQGVGVSVGNKQSTLTTSQMPALLDSGTTLTYLPYSLTELIAGSIGAQYSSRLGYYYMPCPSSNNDTQIVFNFGGFNIATNLTNYILSSGSSGTCILGMIPQSDDSAILGDMFLIHAYVVYDLESYEISMAQARFNATSDDIEAITSTVPGATPAPGYSSTWSTTQSVTSGGNIFTVKSGSTSTTTGSSQRSSGSATSSSKSTSASSTTTSVKKNDGGKLVPTSLFVLFSSILSSLFT